jgi:hypothetical protein
MVKLREKLLKFTRRRNKREEKRGAKKFIKKDDFSTNVFDVKDPFIQSPKFTTKST